MPERLRSFASIANGYLKSGRSVAGTGSGLDKQRNRAAEPRFQPVFSTQPKETFCVMFAVKPYTCAEFPK
jgi:hypothetical protein